jgi:SynChlorMet cassette radical SAM/SPASM protein ScmE
MPMVMPTPRFADLEITSRCNAECRYCYYLNNEGVTYQDLPTRAWLDFFDELGEARVMGVQLAGGEVFLRPDLFELIDGIVKNRMRFEILTNGRLITRETAQRLKETGRLNFIQVSLDGSTAEVHESMRGKGSFAPALNAVRLLREEGLTVTVRVTVHGKNVDDLPAVTRLLLEEIGLPSFSTNSICSLGTHAKYGDDSFLTPALRLHAMRVLAELDERYPGRIRANAGPLADWHSYRQMEEARIKGEKFTDRGRLVGCGCIFSRISVRSDGAYVPCVMLPQMVLGHIGKDPVGEVWRNSPILNDLRSRIHIPLDTFEECRGCDYLHSCTGNCAGTALSLLGDANRPSPDACLRRFKEELAREGLSLW